MTNPHVMVTYHCISATAIRLATQVQTSTIVLFILIRVIDRKV